MSEVKVTEKFQVTIPKDVRKEIGLKSGEMVIVEPMGKEIIIKRFRTIKDPLRVLIGTKKSKHVPIEELEEKAELR